MSQWCVFFVNTVSFFESVHNKVYLMALLLNDYKSFRCLKALEQSKRYCTNGKLILFKKTKRSYCIHVLNMTF